MIRCFLLICILTNNVVFSSTYSIHSRENEENDNHDDTSLESFERTNAPDVGNRREWNYFMETLKTNENLLRHVKPTVLNEKQNSMNNRRSFLNWFSGLNKKNAGLLLPTTTTESSSTTRIINNVDNLEPLLAKLIHILDKLNENVEKMYYQNKTYYVVEARVDNKDRKDVNTVELANDKPILRTDGQKVTEDDLASDTDKPKTECPLGVYNYDKDEDGPVINIKGKKREKRNVNDTEDNLQNVENVTINAEHLNNQNKTDNTTGMDDVFNITNVSTLNSRRSNRPDNIRPKLVKYLHDIYQDIKEELVPVATLKKRFNNDVTFKIGYITANLNSIELNLARLKSDIDSKSDSWDEFEILETFDVLKNYHSMIIKLVDSVKFYLKSITHVA